MDREKAIKEAWGEHFEKFKSIIDMKSGWAVLSLYGKNKELEHTLWEVVNGRKEYFETTKEFNPCMWRPKQLKVLDLSPKMELIEKAYGSAWENVKGLINENGWITRKVIGHGLTNRMEYENFNFDRTDVEIIGINPDGKYTWRPKDLEGIEGNNGWIRMEKEEDLPKKGQLVNVWSKIYNRMEDSPKSWDGIVWTKQWFVAYFSHWQPIQEIKPPMW